MVEIKVRDGQYLIKPKHNPANIFLTIQYSRNISLIQNQNQSHNLSKS